MATIIDCIFDKKAVFLLSEIESSFMMSSIELDISLKQLESLLPLPRTTGDVLPVATTFTDTRRFSFVSRLNVKFNLLPEGRLSVIVKNPDANLSYVPSSASLNNFTSTIF